jgi:hypothetical protein
MKDFEEVVEKLGFRFVDSQYLKEFLNIAQEQWCYELEKNLDLKKGQGKIYLDRLEDLLGLEECQNLNWDQIQQWVLDFQNLDKQKGFL